MSTEVAPRVLHSTTFRVQMADVDAAGLLYYTTPYRWQEGLFTAWLDALGHPLGQMLRTRVGCPAIHSSADYLRAIALDDRVKCLLVTDHVGTTSFGVSVIGRVEGEDEPAVRTTTRHVWVEGDDRGGLSPAPLPGWLQRALVGD